MIHIYTGEGKGKTTAALGLVLRACGADKKIFIGQFIKGKNYSEVKALKKFCNVELEQFGRGVFIKGKLQSKDIELAKSGWLRIQEIIKSKKYDLVVIDEINVAIDLGLIDCEQVVKFLKKVSKKIEIVLTGRAASECLIEIADLVSEVKEVKHYYKKGIKARRGIEF